MPQNRSVFRDEAAPTLVLCRQDRAVTRTLGAAEVVGVAAIGEQLSVPGVLAALRARGLRRIFVEGGGITVSRFLSHAALDRLHVTVGSVFLGAGRPGIALPGIDGLERALRPRTRRFFMGEDVLFDCVFRP